MCPFRFSNVTPSTFQLFFLAFPLFCPTYQILLLAFQCPGHLLSKCFLTACLLQFPPSYLWLYFLCSFIFDHKSHFAYHHTVLLCDTLIHYYLTIAYFLQVPPSAHHIIYLGTFTTTFIRHPVFIFFLEISVDNCQILFSQNPQSLILPYFLFHSTVPPHFFLIPYVSFAHMSIKDL